MMDPQGVALEKRQKKHPVNKPKCMVSQAQESITAEAAKREKKKKKHTNTLGGPLLFGRRVDVESLISE